MLEMYLRCLTGPKPKDWVRWVSWAEYCYNTSWHSATQTTFFEAVYGRAPPNLLSYVPGIAQSLEVDESLHAWDRTLELLRTNLVAAQNKMKEVYGKKHTSKEFVVGDWVYLKLQNYWKGSVEHCLNHNLSPQLFGPY